MLIPFGCLQRFLRAGHIVQIPRWGADLVGRAPISQQESDRWRMLDADPGMLVLEFMRHGDLSGFIEKVVATGVRANPIPGNILWKIFFCRKNHLAEHSGPPYRSRAWLTTYHDSSYSRKGLYRYAIPS